MAPSTTRFANKPPTTPKNAHNRLLPAEAAAPRGGCLVSITYVSDAPEVKGPRCIQLHYTPVLPKAREVGKTSLYQE